MLALALRAAGAAFMSLVAIAPSIAQDAIVTVADASSLAFNFPSPLLAPAERRAFAVGNSLFRSNWVTAPASAAGVDGLGPLFNARSCSTCHLRDGRSCPPEEHDEEHHGLLLRIGVRAPGGGADLAHPAYGVQIQDAAVPGARAEARIDLQWPKVRGEYGDGESFELVAPKYELRDLGYGALGDGVVLGGRVAPQLIGLGLLEAIPAATLDALADPDDRDGDGISGRLHVLAVSAPASTPASTPAPTPALTIGRFGWKATQPTVHDQVAAALVHDMGITSGAHPTEDLTPAEAELAALPNGGAPEIDADKLARLVFYSRVLAVPAPRDAHDPAVLAGRDHFMAFGCAKCHVPETTTGADAWHPAFASRTVRAFTDLLLHDLGPGLADDKHDGDASPGEWRTAPLWGIGLIPVVNGHERYLHDGRARGLAEAVLWHGGEALAARERFRTASRAHRDELLAFVRSL